MFREEGKLQFGDFNQIEVQIFLYKLYIDIYLCV